MDEVKDDAIVADETEATEAPAEVTEAETEETPAEDKEDKAEAE